MKNVFTLLAFMAVCNIAICQSVAINADGSNPDTSAILDIKSTVKGLLIPRMTTAQKTAIITPAIGLMVYQTDGTKGFYYYTGTTWYFLNDNGNGPWVASGTNLYARNTAYNVGIGNTKPLARLHVTAPNDVAITLEDTATLAAGIKTSMYFKAKNFYYGGIKATGTSGNSGRLGFYTYASADSSQLLERMSITDAGYVGINNSTPATQLDVNGTFRSIGYAYLNNGVSIGGDANITNNANIGGNAVITGSAQVTGNITSNGRAAVVGSNGTQLKVVVYTATLSVTNLAGNTLLGATGNIVISAGTFSSAPSAYVGDIVASSENGDYYRAVIIPDQVTTTNVRIKIFNPTPNPITFSNVTWKVFVIGPQ